MDPKLEQALENTHFNAKYSPEQKLAAVAEYVATGNSEKAGALIGASGRQIRNWKQEDWWSEAVRRIKEQQEEELKATLINTALVAWKGTLDRAQRGDIVVDSNGRKKRKKLSGKELAVIAEKATNFMRLLDNQVTEITTYDPSALANKFRTLVVPKKEEDEDA